MVGLGVLVRSNEPGARDLEIDCECDEHTNLPLNLAMTDERFVFAE